MMARSTLLLLGTVLASGVSSAAFAQQNAPNPVTAAAPTDQSDTSTADEKVAAGLDDIVVTARRRDEASQTVPIAITALSGSQLEEKGVRAVEDLRSFSPSLNVGGQRRDEANFYLRGQSPGVIQAGQRNFTSVATYFAEVPTTISGPGTFYDLASVQILKGPQGTLFGRNTTGGAVLFEPAHPTQEIEGYAQAKFGNYGYKELEFMVNAPFIPGLASLRLAGVVSRRDGYTKSIVSGQDLDARNYEAMRASLLLTPGDRLQSLTIVDYRAKDQPGSSLVLRQVNPSAALGSLPTSPALARLLGLPAGTSVTLPIRAGGSVSVACLSAALPGCPTGPFGGAVAAFQAAYNGGNFADPANGGFGIIGTTAQLQQALATQQAIGPRRTQIPDLMRAKQLNVGITNKTTFDINDDITLKNIVAFRRSRSNDATDYDGTALSTIVQLPALQEWSSGQDQFTEEFQVQGKIPSANLNYIVGYYHEFSKPGFDQSSPSVQFGTYSLRKPSNKDKSDAVYGHVEWEPIPLVGISGGVRQTWDKRQSTLSIFNAAGACTLIVPGTTTIQCPIVYNAGFKALTYDATVNLKPTDRILVYGAFRHGYKSGGFTQPAPDGYQIFRPETVDDFEVGIKADWDIGVPLRTNISAYYDKYKDVQVVSPTLVNGNFTTIVQNIGKQTNKGVEVETSIRPVRSLTLSGLFSYSSAVSDVQVVAPTGQQIVVAGRQVPFSPKYKYGVSGVWTLPVHTGTEGGVTLSADYSWQAEQNTSDFAAAINKYPSYGLLNARLDWKDAIRPGIDLSLFGTNLTNKTYILGGFPLTTQLGFESSIYGEPRMYGGSIRIHWGPR